MAGVSRQLGRAALVDPLTLALAVGAAAILARRQVNSAWLVLGGGLVGLARSSRARLVQSTRHRWKPPPFATPPGRCRG